VQQQERLSTILERLASHGSVAVTEISTELGVSSATVRRDLELLEGQRLLGRTHGGAVANRVVYELPLRYKSMRQAAEKRRIAAEAASRILDGWAIGLTGGTTTTEVARALADRSDLTIVTNALNIAAEIAIRPNLKLVITGGVARPQSYELVGPIAEASLAGLNLDVVFLSVDGISERTDVTTHHELEASTDLALIRRAKVVTVVADSTKVGRSAFARICPVEAVDELITDSAVDPVEAAALRERGLKITLV